MTLTELSVGSGSGAIAPKALIASKYTFSSSLFFSLIRQVHAPLPQQCRRGRPIERHVSSRALFGRSSDSDLLRLPLAAYGRVP